MYIIIKDIISYIIYCFKNFRLEKKYQGKSKVSQSYFGSPTYFGTWGWLFIICDSNYKREKLYPVSEANIVNTRTGIKKRWFYT